MTKPLNETLLTDLTKTCRDASKKLREGTLGAREQEALTRVVRVLRKEVGELQKIADEKAGETGKTVFKFWDGTARSVADVKRFLRVTKPTVKEERE